MTESIFAYDGRMSTEGSGSRRRRGETRRVMAETAAALLCERGVAGTTIDKVLAQSGAPRGSVYHHFPGGRAELLSAAVEHAADAVVRTMRAGGEAGPAAVLDGFVDFWRRQLLASDYRAGCPVLAVAVDDDPEFPELADLAARSFARWQEELVGILVHHGMAPGAADTLALQALSQLEGAVVLCRAHRDMAPLDAAAEAVAALHAAAAT